MECYKIFSNPIIKVLLKNEATIFGSFVRKMLFQDYTFIEYISDSDNRIKCFCKEIYRDIIERDLNEYIVKIYKKDKNALRNEYSTYKLRYKGNTIFLDVNYVKNSLNFYMKYYTNELGLFLDIDCLYIDRLGLGILDFSELYKTEPVPMYKIMNNMHKKLYNVLISDSSMDKSFLKHIQPLVKDGWCNAKRCKAEIKDMRDEKCDICLVNHDESSIVLDCGHTFHFGCIAKYLEVIICDSNDLARCPYCQGEIDMNEIL